MTALSDVRKLGRDVDRPGIATPFPNPAAVRGGRALLRAQKISVPFSVPRTVLPVENVENRVWKRNVKTQRSSTLA
jgi:hypothetical protein